MLKRLFIENYALIDHLDITFPGELVIITGETGAGKSILLGALALALGGRSDASVLKDRTRNCVVEAWFEGDDGERIIRRVVSPQGRSRGFIDDLPAGVEALRAAAAELIDIHSQNQQLLLSESDFQRMVLDSHAGLLADVEAHGRSWRSLLEARRALQDLDGRIAAAGRERDYLEFQYSQLVEAALRPGEIESLEEEQGRLAHGESVLEQVSRVGLLFEDGECSMEGRLKEMTAALGKVTDHFPEFGDLAARLESARIELKDIRSEVEALGERIVFSPERLAEVDERLARLYGLMRKFDVPSVEDLISLRDSIAARLDEEEDLEAERLRLSRQVEELQVACTRSAEALHAARTAAAEDLAAVLQEQVRSLELPRARFAVQVESTPNGSTTGSDRVEFFFDANGQGLQPLSKCASGGELSRIMLCIKALLARYRGMPTLIFDEIDTGTSGSVAEKIGRMLAQMGRNMQLFAITHLPQVASKGDAHYLVYKETGPDGTRTAIRRLEGADRQKEIARMLSGADITPEALANAAVLLKDNNVKQ